MVKIKNVFGNINHGRQDNAVYQRKYGQGMRRMYKEVKPSDSPLQKAQQDLFKQGIDWVKSLSKNEKDAIKEYCRNNNIGFKEGQPIHWYNWAKSLAMKGINFKIIDPETGRYKVEHPSILKIEEFDINGELVKTMDGLSDILEEKYQSLVLDSFNPLSASIKITTLPGIVVESSFTPLDNWDKLFGLGYYTVTVHNTGPDNFTNYPLNVSINTANLISLGVLDSSATGISVLDSNKSPVKYYVDYKVNTSSTNIFFESGTFNVGSSKTFYIVFNNVDALNTNKYFDAFNFSTYSTVNFTNGDSGYYSCYKGVTIGGNDYLFAIRGVDYPYAWVLYNPVTNTIFKSAATPNNRGRGGDVSPDGKWLAVGGGGNGSTVDLYNIQNNWSSSRIYGLNGYDAFCTFSPDSKWLVVEWLYHSRVYVYNLTTMGNAANWSYGTASGYYYYGPYPVFNPSGTRLAFTAGPGRLVVRDTSSSSPSSWTELSNRQVDTTRVGPWSYVCNGDYLAACCDSTKKLLILHPDTLVQIYSKTYTTLIPVCITTHPLLKNHIIVSFLNSDVIHIYEIKGDINLVKEITNLPSGNHVNHAILPNLRKLFFNMGTSHRSYNYLPSSVGISYDALSAPEYKD